MSTNVKFNQKLDYKLFYQFNNLSSDTPNKLINGATIISQVKLDSENNLLLLGYSNYFVRLAVSCLIHPLDGDRVCAIVDGNNLYITAIIARKEYNKNLTIGTNNQNINILADNVEFVVNKKILINAERFALFSERSDWTVKISHYKYNKVYINSSTYCSSIENTSEMYARNIVFKAEQSYTLRSKIGVLTSDGMLKLDGGQIHMG